jgi:hypothetical protein
MNTNLSAPTPARPVQRHSFFANLIMMVLIILINQLLHPKPHPVPDLKPGLFQPGYRIPLGPTNALYIPPFHDVNGEVSPH